MKEILFIGESPSQENKHAGSKARIDIEFLLQKKGYIKAVNITNSNNTKTSISKFFNKLKKLRLYIKISRLRNTHLIMQYPYYLGNILKTALYKKMKNNKVVLFIHDINSLRNAGELDLQKEINLLNNAAVLIVHNQNMINELTRAGVTTSMISLNLFDYLLDKNIPCSNYQLSNSIVFAGNIEKSIFLKSNIIEKLNIKFNLYGPNYDKDTINWDNITYKGSFYPNEVPYVLEGSFGLIWDGTSCETCTGDVGEYMKYNNPHKLSLYIAAGLPVIVWEKAAVAEFVKKHNIGFTVNSLTEIEKNIESLTEEEYCKYLIKIRVLQKKVYNGYFTNRALDQAITLLE